MRKFICLLGALIICGTALISCETREISSQTDVKNTATTKTTSITKSTTSLKKITTDTSFSSKITDISTELLVSNETTISDNETEITSTQDNSIVSYDKFIEAYKSLSNGNQISVKESKIYSLAQEVKNKDELYISLTNIKFNKHRADTTTQMALKGDHIAIINENEEYSTFEYVDNLKYTKYYSPRKTAEEKNLDQQSLEEMQFKSRFIDLIDYVIPDDFDETHFLVKTYEVKIEGKQFTFETIESESNFTGIRYYVYDNDGALCARGMDDLFEIYLINKIDYNVSSDIFVQPTGYTIQNAETEN